MPTLLDVLKNREQYPDTLTYKVGEQEYTLGDLRNNMIPKADYTKESQRWSQEKQQLADQYNQRLSFYDQQLQQLNQALANRGQPPASNAEDALSRLDQDAADPTLGPYAKSLRKVLGEMGELKEQLTQANKRMQQHEEAWWLDKHSQVINRIRDKDPEYHEPAKVQELLSYAQQNGIPNLDLAYQLKTRERDIAKVRDEAVKEAETRLKAQQEADATAPHIPSGSAGTVAGPGQQTWTPPEGTLDPWEAAAQAAAQDSTLEKVGQQFAESWEGRPAS